MDDTYADLTLEEAIVLNTVEDYKMALIRLKRCPNSKFAQQKVKEMEMYFYSPDFEWLTNLNPDYLIRKMKQLVDEEY